MLAILLRLN